MSSSQMLKGILEGCILAVIAEKEVYGYEMTEILARYGLNMVSEGSIYPILLKLQKQNSVTSEMRASQEGPKRKYYQITEKGREQLREFQSDWFVLSGSVNKLMDQIKTGVEEHES
ncbi:PadR family transcriptional regulator [Bacillus sp. AGMB 02131]|uniref:PadR family transcriptional regulator n=1 Tax=Peribacillus faecalis TaxID=2772559 RepID=A0A927HAR1_9BACI|nr:PadR family transcriptional regulator [Peribacillus faecalis]MBD3107812.1 PadR family transcriptional regulator [Peribacillus faecalis]